MEDNTPVRHSRTLLKTLLMLMIIGMAMVLVAWLNWQAPPGPATWLVPIVAFPSIAAMFIAVAMAELKKRE